MRVIEPIPIDLDKPRTLLLTLPALKAIEDHLAKQRGARVNLFQLFQSGDLGAMEMVTIVWAGLRHEDKGLTIEKTLALLERVSMQDVGEVIQRAFRCHVAAPAPEPLPPVQEANDASPLA